MTVVAALLSRARSLWPGIVMAVVVALAARFLSDHYGAPAMLMALLLGMAFAFLSEEGRCVTGIEFSARSLLRLGVALLGARISLAALAALGAPVISITVLAVLATILFGLLGARLLRRSWRFGVLTGGSVALCGASAAMALASVLPRSENVGTSSAIIAGSEEVDDPGFQIYRAVGCDDCDRGYRGRTGVYEVMPFSEAMGRIIMEGGSLIVLSMEGTQFHTSFFLLFNFGSGIR